MIDYLYIILFISMFCCGLRKMANKGMILHRADEWLWKRVENTYSELWYLPLIGCVFCMASFWGSAIYWSIQSWRFISFETREVWVMWPVVCISCVFLNGVFYGALAKAEKDF